MVRIYLIVLLFFITVTASALGSLQQNFDSLLNRAGSSSLSSQERTRAATKAWQLAEKETNTQHKIDALLKLGELSLKFSQYQQAQEWFWKARFIAERAEKTQDLAIAHNNLGMTFLQLGGYTDSVEYHFDASFDAYSKNMKFRLEAAGVIQNSGILQHQLGNYDKALTHYLNAVGLFQKERADKELAICFHNIGLVHQELNQIEKASGYFRKSSRLASTVADSITTASAYENLGICLSNEQLDSALFYYQMSLDIYKRLKSPHHLAKTYDLMASLYVQKGQHHLAQIMYQKAFAFLNKLGEHANALTALIRIGEMQLALQKPDSALIKAKKALSLAKKLRNNAATFRSYHLALNSYLELSEDTVAKKYTSQMMAWRDSLFGDEKIKAIEDAEVRYQTTKVKLDLVIAESEIEMQSQRIKVRNYGLFAAAVVSLLIMILLYREKMNKVKIRQEHENTKRAQADTENIYADMIHRFDNNFQIMRSTFTLMEERSGSEELKAFARQSRMRITAMTELHNSAYKQQQFEYLDLSKYLETIYKSLLVAMGVRRSSIDTELNLESVVLPAKKSASIGLIVSELIANSVKHALTHVHHPVFKMNLQSKRSTCIIQLEDNGPGYEPLEVQKAQKGIGLPLVNERIAFLKGHIETASNSKGTIHTIEFSLTQQE